MLGRKNDAHPQKVLDVDASLQGNLVFKDAVNLQINGSFEGKLETKGEYAHEIPKPVDCLKFHRAYNLKIL